MTRLHQEVLDALLARIVDGAYPTGAMLPKEESLAQEFGISRGTAREALRALEERQVAVVKHGRGAQVRSPEEWNTLDANVARALIAGHDRRPFAREVQRLRLMIEPEAAALAAEHASNEQRAALYAHAVQVPTTEDPARVARLLRRLVATAAGNRPLAATLRALDDGIEPPLRSGDFELCAQLAEAVAAGDADGARAAARRLNAQ